MVLDRLQEAVSLGLSVVREAPSCVPGEVDSRMAFSRKLLFPFMLLAAGAGCRNTNVETESGWDGTGVCFTEYSDAFPDEPIGRGDFVGFGAMSDDYYDVWPEDAYPLGYIDSYGAEMSDVRVFINTGAGVGGTQLAIAGNFLGSSYADEGTISKYPADYASFCEEEDGSGSFFIIIYNPKDRSGASDVEIVGKTRRMGHPGEAFTYAYQTTYFYNLLPEVVTGVDHVGSAEDSGTDTNTEVEVLPSTEELFDHQIVDFVVGQTAYDDSIILLSERWDALEDLDEHGKGELDRVN